MALLPAAIAISLWLLRRDSITGKYPTDSRTTEKKQEEARFRREQIDSVLLVMMQRK
jgi:hypothetical protein